MSFKGIDFDNKRHQIIVESLQSVFVNELDFQDLKINEEDNLISYHNHMYSYTFYKVGNKTYCSIIHLVLRNDKDYTITYLKQGTSNTIHGRTISSRRATLQMNPLLAKVLLGVASASVISLGLFAKKPASKQFETEVAVESSLEDVVVPSTEDIPIVEPLDISSLVERETLAETKPDIVHNFATIQIDSKREGTKYFSYEGTTTGRNLLKARNTTEFMGDEITKWSNYFGLDPKFTMALFSMERPWLPMDNDLVKESYNPIHLGEGEELNIAQITTGSAGVYTVPTFDGDTFLGYRTYDNGTGSGKGEAISIREAKNNRSLSIKDGCMLLAYHINKYQGNAIYAALAYNTGENHVNTQISEEEFFRNGNSSTLDDKTYAKDLVRYMLHQGITNCNFKYIDKDTGEVKTSMYDFDTTNRKFNYKEMNINSSDEIPRLASETFAKYLEKYGLVKDKVSSNKYYDEDIFELVEDDYMNLSR